MQDLDKFKNEMNLSGKNVYVGQRYVPKIFGEWDNTQLYEPLSIVQYQGDSYTSRQYVPAGVEITNEDYWAATGNYNAQVEQYRQSVRNLENNVNNINDEVISARGGEVTLNERLDKDKKEVNAHLTQTAINVKSFGAVGDGVTDDGQAIKAAHEFANTVNTKVFYPSGKYYMNEVTNIPVMTDIDARDAELIIDLTYGSDESLYNVLPKNEKYSFKGILDGLTLKTTDKKVPTFSGMGEILVRVYNDNHIMFKRYGDNANDGGPMFDDLVIDNLGNLKNEIKWNFNQVTRAEISPIDNTYLNIVIGNITIMNNKDTLSYVWKNIKINRSRVNLTIMDEKLVPLERKTSFRGLIEVSRCAYVNIKDTNLETKPSIENGSGTVIGSYGMLVGGVCFLTLDNVNSKSIPSVYNGWGIMGGNNLKDLVVKNSNLNRIDSHQSAHNIKVVDSVIGGYGIQVTGSGNLIIENVTFNADRCILLRTDFGSTWDGDITIKNIKQIPTGALGNTLSFIINGNGILNHDFGYECHFGRKIHIENVEIDDSLYNKNGVIGIWVAEVNKATNPYYLPEKMTLKNIYTVSGKKPTGFDTSNYTLLTPVKDGSHNRVNEVNYIKPNVEISIENCDFDIYVMHSSTMFEHIDGYQFTAKTPYFKYNFKDIPSLSVGAVLGSAPNIYNVKNCVVKRMCLYSVSTSRAVLNINDSVIDIQNNHYLDSIRGDYKSSNIVNTIIKPPLNGAGEIVTSKDGINRMHELIKFQVNSENKVRTMSNLVGCIFDVNYPLNSVIPNWENLPVEFSTFLGQRWYPLG